MPPAFFGQADLPTCVVLDPPSTLLHLAFLCHPMSFLPPVIQLLPTPVEELPTFVRILEKFDLPLSDLLVPSLIQRLDLHQRRAPIRQIRPLFKDNGVTFHKAPGGDRLEPLFPG